MEESNPEVRGFSTAEISEFENNNRFCGPGSTVSQISPGDVHYDAHIPEWSSAPHLFHPKLPCRVGRASQETVLPGHTAQECEDDKGAKPLLGSAGRECCCWNCVANRHGTAEPVNRDASRWGKIQTRTETTTTTTTKVLAVIGDNKKNIYFLLACSAVRLSISVGLRAMRRIWRRRCH